MRARFFSPLLTIVICAIMIMVNNARAYPLADQSSPPDGPAVPGVAISPLLHYQGRMTNPTTGQPIADGVYAVTFSLYDVAAGGTAKWTETKNVPVAGGLFSTALGDTSALPQSLFSGQALWLGIKVGADLEATPRQAIVPVAYALSLVPGAAITGSLSSPALRVSNSSGPALVTSGATTLGGNVTINGSLSGGTHAHSGADITSGTVVDARLDAALARDAEVAVSYYNKTEAEARYVNTTGPDAIFANSTVAALAVNQSGTGQAGYFTSTATFGVKGETASTTSGQAGLLGTAGSASTLNRVAGVLGNSTNGFGVAGTSTNHYGVVGFSSNSIGVRGESSTGANPGVWGGSWGTGPGVYGLGVNGHGVQGAGDTAASNYGGFFTGWGGIYAEGTNGGNGGEFASTSGYGLYATADSIGVWGNSTGSAGVYGTSPSDWGVYGSSPNGYALYGNSTDGYGLYARTYTTTRYAGYFYNGGGAGTNRGVGVAAFTGNGSSNDLHPGGSYYKAAGEFSGPDGILAATSADATSGDAIHAITTVSGSGQWALRATKAGGGNYAGYFTGNVYVLGDLIASGTKPFKID
ncbi:MAG: hypothetical protein KA765_15200, partial [Thermoflexales bacterium]|nr:hypothetical protein [Thermoflexales bacterium]